MSDFKASRDLSPEDFAHFARQYVNDLERYRVRLNNARNEAKNCERTAKEYLRMLNSTKAQMLKHGIEVPE